MEVYALNFGQKSKMKVDAPKFGRRSTRQISRVDAPKFGQKSRKEAHNSYRKTPIGSRNFWYMPWTGCLNVFYSSSTWSTKTTMEHREMKKKLSFKLVAVQTPLHYQCTSALFIYNMQILKQITISKRRGEDIKQYSYEM